MTYRKFQQPPVAAEISIPPRCNEHVATSNDKHPVFPHHAPYGHFSTMLSNPKNKLVNQLFLR